MDLFRATYLRLGEHHPKDRHHEILFAANSWEHAARIAESWQLKDQLVSINYVRKLAEQQKLELELT